MTDFDPDLIHLKDTKVSIMYDGELHVGILTFAGINKLHGQYQVTINRRPFWPVDKQTIKQIL